MKSKGRIKFFTYALILSMSTTTLTGCDIGAFRYSINKEGNVVIEPKMWFSTLKQYKLIELEYASGERKIFIAGKIFNNGCVEYWQISTTDVVYKELKNGDTLDIGVTLVKEMDLEPFLITYDEVKKSYTMKEIEQIYEKILADYEFEKDKKLEK